MSNPTQDQNSAVMERFASLFKDYETILNGKSKQTAHTYRQAAIDKLKDLRFPTRRDEDWKYTSVARVVEEDYVLGEVFDLDPATLQQYAASDIDVYDLVFTNGQLHEGLSNWTDLPKGLTIEKLTTTLNGTAVQEMLSHDEQVAMDDVENPFIAINAAFSQDGMFIHVARNTVVDKPIRLLYFTQNKAGNPVLTTPKITLIAEENSEATIIESYYGLDHQTASFSNSVNRFLVKENARLSHYKIQVEGPAAYQIVNTAVQQARNSTFTSFSIDLGGKIVRNNISAYLGGQGISSNLYGVYLPQDQQHVDTQTFIDHAMPHCVSNELYKGIIDDRGRGVFNGKVLVRQDAQKTNAFQQNSTLVLSEKGIMDSKPQLEIFADDVRCSHGATIGQLDESAVYYLKARGLSDQQARQLLQFAFIGEVLENIPLDAIRNHVSGLVNRKLVRK